MAIQPTLSGLLLPATISLPDTQDLRDWPNIPAEVVCRHAKQLGAAGEALFDSQMLCFGEIGLPVPEFLPFDRVLLRSPRLLRVQIKTVTMPSDHGYAVTPRKGYRGSPQGMRAYEADEYDLLAIVILSEGVIRYGAATAGRQRIPLSAIRRLREDPRASFDAALADLDGEADTLPVPGAA
ncbi:MAG TPA: hypothetical protein GX696_06390 [Pseudomonadaceae bacterium]|nr:hypothetical protein [Pseudomonadaceae bacterium]